MVQIEQHPQEKSILDRALNGDPGSVHKVLTSLASIDPKLVKAFQEAIRDYLGPEIWVKLFDCLALHQWDSTIQLEMLFDADSIIRIEQSIFEVFIRDEHGWEKSLKEVVLIKRMDNAKIEIQQAVGYLIGIRGDIRAIPMLAETIETGIYGWKLRAVKALAVLNDERCCPLLIKALTMDRGRLHREACRVLHGLGEVAKPAWVKALNNPDPYIQWQAACGLCEIGDARAVNILAEGLLDDSYAVRWASANALAQLDANSTPAILKILIQHELTNSLRHAAYHALNGIAMSSKEDSIKPMLNALNTPTASVDVPVEANRLLMDFKLNLQLQSHKLTIDE